MFLYWDLRIIATFIYYIEITLFALRNTKFKKARAKILSWKNDLHRFALMVALVRFVFQPPLQASQRNMKITVFFRVEVWVLWHLLMTQQEQWCRAHSAIHMSVLDWFSELEQMRAIWRPLIMYQNGLGIVTIHEKLLSTQSGEHLVTMVPGII